MFAIGDKVEINYPSSKSHGMKGTVVAYHSDPGVYDVDMHNGWFYICKPNELSPISKPDVNIFKIGQTVRLVNLMNAANVFNGQYGTIISESKNLSNVWNVKLHDGTFADLIPENCMESVEEKLKTKIEMPHDIITIKDAIKFELENKKPKYEGQAAMWHRDGKCPKCGVLGYFSMSVAICKDHGEY